jgi:hypothetical protein
MVMAVVHRMVPCGTAAAAVSLTAMHDIETVRNNGVRMSALG